MAIYNFIQYCLLSTTATTPHTQSKKTEKEVAMAILGCQPSSFSRWQMLPCQHPVVTVPYQLSLLPTQSLPLAPFIGAAEAGRGLTTGVRDLLL